MSIIINQKPLTLVKKAYEPLSLRKKAARAKLKRRKKATYDLERFSQRFCKILSVATKSSAYSAHSVVLFIIHSWLFMSIIINQKPLTLVKKAH